MDLKSWNCYLEELVGAVERRRPVDPSQDPQFIDVKSLIKQQKTLDPQLWDGEKLKPEIVDHLIKIARKFFKSLDIGPDVIIKDITLTGSLASFNWSDYSDVDLHILLDFNQFENPDLIKDLVRNAASNWNNKHDIKIKGYEVEMYVQDANEPHHSLGVFSLQNSRFLKTPQRFNEKIDSGAVKEKANDLMEKIDDIYDIYADQKYDLAEKRADYIIKKIRNYRKAGLEQDGPYSIENLVFKVLRRNGYLEKIINLKTNSYDKRMSINYDTRIYEGLIKEAKDSRDPKKPEDYLQGELPVINRYESIEGYRHLTGTKEDVRRDVARAALDMDATDFEKQVLFRFLAIETGGGNPIHTKYNPEVAQFAGTQNRPHYVFYPVNPKTGRRPKNKNGALKRLRLIGSFQILQDGRKGRYTNENSYKKYGYNPDRWADPYEQAKVVINFIRKQVDKGFKDPTLIYLGWNQGGGGRAALMRGMRDYANTPIKDIPEDVIPDGVKRNMIGNYYKAKASTLTPQDFYNRYKRHMSRGSGNVPEAYDGTQVYIVGDSNTKTHEGYWFVWSRKNFPKSKINFFAEPGYKIPTILQYLDKVNPKKTKMIIIGSLGGNDAQDLKGKDFGSQLEPGGRYNANNIIPLMEKLESLQRKGIRVKFFGLPFGRGSDPNREKARAAMDLALLTAAQEYDIDYTTVFEKTKQIKGKTSGVHYKKDRRRAYRDHLADLIGGKQPLPNEEIAYMKGIKSTGINRNYFLAPYRVIEKTAFKFNDFYNDLEKEFPGKVGSGNKILPIHGKDYIFGPEHFVAMKLLSNKLPRSKYAEMVRLKTKQRQIKGVDRVEQKHEKEIS